jgi:hypothetical protein
MRPPSVALLATARRCARFAFFAALLAGLAFRAITPAGYMPGTLADGTPFVLCPGSTPGAQYFLDRSGDAHQHRHHHDPADGKPDVDRSWEFCPIGAAFAAIAPAYELPPETVSEGAAIAMAPAAVVPRYVGRGNRRARGPPPIAS